MAIVVSDVGIDTILKGFFNNTWPAGGRNLTLKLFCNNKTPSANGADVAGDYTEVTNGDAGYASKTLTNGSWTVSVGNDPSDAVYAQQTWTFTGPLTLSATATVYGIFVVDADGVLVWAERFGSSFTPFNNNDKINYTPKFAASYGTPVA